MRPTRVSVLHRFLIQKYLFRLFFALAFVLFIGIFVYAFKTEMAMEQVGAQAPFAADTLIAKNDTLPELRSITRDEPHRTARELAVWVSQSVSEVLTFDAPGFAGQMRAAEKYFSVAGYQEFKAYIQQANLEATLKNGDQKVNVLVEQPPLLLNSGPAGGVYKWLYEVPVTISYTPRQLRELRPDNKMTQGRKLTVRLQLGRYDDAMTTEGVRIETWAVSARRN